ncbi:MAG TPA: serine/threonine-protein kinase [Gemmatimonadaceae bacterium]
MPDPTLQSSDSELRTRVERALAPQYELDREIGRGGMGIVYRARDARLKRAVAVKLLPPELAYRGEIRSRFLREAETAAQLSHPHIVPIHAVDERDGLVYFVMGYVEGENLARRLHERGRLDPDETRRILCEVGNALAYAHARGVIHRDIKPDNILLEKESGRAMVTDFGIARAVSDSSGDSRLTATGTAIGTPAFMSPEQCAGDREIDGRSDLYSLGVVGYQMLTGELPFTAPNTPMMLVKHISERPLPIEQKRTDLPPDMARAIMMLLEKEPADRFPSASALVAALESGEMPLLPASPAGGTRRGTGAAALASSSSAYASTAPSGTGALAPAAESTSEEIQRWYEPQVQEFRKKFTIYAFVAPVLAILELTTNAGPFGFFAIIWTIFIVYNYAKLWTNGFDWRDVLKQPRDRLFADVASEAMDDARALWDPNKRQEVRERTRLRHRSSPRLPAGTSTGRTSTAGGALPALDAAVTGPQAERIRQAKLDRDYIVQLIEALPSGERTRVADVIPSAFALYARIVSLANAIPEAEREVVPGAAEEVEREIERLEAQANPLEGRASDERVRRLAQLRRQRRALRDVVRRRDDARSALDSCALALQNMRFEVLRLRAGTLTPQGITELANQALALARDVDVAVSAAGEVSRLTRSSTNRPSPEQR